MALKVYIKRGNINYKERKLVTALQKVIGEKMDGDASFQFEPANSFEELKALHSKYCIDDVAFEETGVKENSSSQESSSGNTSSINYDDPDYAETERDKNASSPINRQEPNIRDYVLDEDQSTQKEKISTGPQRTVFEEPTSFGESFEIPNDIDDDSNGNNNQSSQNNKQSTGSGNNRGQGGAKNPTQPVNPNYNDMSGAKKRSSTRRMAKGIVNIVCKLSELGFVWYANKDINDAKLAEYELNNEMDLGILISLEDGQEATVKQFFQQQALKAEQLSKIGDAEKQQLIDALVEVMLEKGVAPTPMQELLLASAEIFGIQIANLFVLKSQSDNVLSQLRAMHNPNNQVQEHKEPEQQRQQPKEQPKKETTWATMEVVEDISDIKEAQVVKKDKTEEEVEEFLLTEGKKTKE